MLTGLFDHKTVVGFGVQGNVSLIGQRRRNGSERWVAPLEHLVMEPFPSRTWCCSAVSALILTARGPIRNYASPCVRPGMEVRSVGI